MIAATNAEDENSIGTSSATRECIVDSSIPISGKPRRRKRQRRRNQLITSGPEVQRGDYSTKEWFSDLKVKIFRVKSKISKIVNVANESECYSEGELADSCLNSKNHIRKPRSISEMCSQTTHSHVRSLSFSASSSSSSATTRVDAIIKAGAESQEPEHGQPINCLIRNKHKGTPLVDQFCGRKYPNQSDRLVLDSLSLFLLDLLATPTDKRERLIASQALQRGILIEEENTWKLHPGIAKSEMIFRTNYNQIYRNFAGKTFAHKKFASPVQVELPTEKNFEDFVNSVIHTGLPVDQHEQFSFPLTSKIQRSVNYIKEEEFEDRLEEFAQNCVRAGLGVIVEEEVRISAKNNDHAYIKVPEHERDAIISSQLLRKFALHGDIVRAFVRIVSEKEITKENLENTDNGMSGNVDPHIDETEVLKEEPLFVAQNSKAFVIKIAKEVNSRLVVGTFLPHRKKSTYMTFVPRDMRMPNIRIYEENWPALFKKGKPKDANETLYVAEIVHWEDNICVGKIVQQIGKCGELDAEKRAIMLKNNLVVEPFDENINKLYAEEFQIPEEEWKRREDCTRECIFTIDPLTAQDLDDAVSIRELCDGNFEVGVHISDVTYFLGEDTVLDKLVKNRTTSVYMINEAFHMLPKSLCQRCSLLPARDKMAFSVFWKMSRDAEILSTRYSRTIIRSCTKLAYQHAQKIIESTTCVFSENDLPQIHNGFTVEDVVRCVKQLNSLSTLLRERRFQNGALKIDRPKICFDLDPESGEPVSYKLDEQLSANFLIEEFMLLANQYVAGFIYEKFPSLSILRNHEPPLKNVLKRIKDLLEKNGMLLEVKSAKSIFCSLKRLVAASENPKSASVCLSHLLSKPMIRAKYFCSHALQYEKFSHYALSIPIYTHFTSPIRRYSDILVHRVLAAALNYDAVPKRSPAELKVLADRCNDDKYNAKQAGEDSINFYFMRYLQRNGPVRMLATVVDIYEFTFDAILVETGMVISVKWKESSKVNVSVSKESDRFKVKLVYPTLGGKEVNVKLCTEIWLELTAGNKQLKGKLVPPPTDDDDKEEIANNSADSHDCECELTLHVDEQSTLGAQKLHETVAEPATAEGIPETNLNASTTSEKVLTLHVDEQSTLGAQKLHETVAEPATAEGIPETNLNASTTSEKVLTLHVDEQNTLGAQKLHETVAEPATAEGIPETNLNASTTSEKILTLHVDEQSTLGAQKLHETVAEPATAEGIPETNLNASTTSEKVLTLHVDEQSTLGAQKLHEPVAEPATAEGIPETNLNASITSEKVLTLHVDEQSTLGAQKLHEPVAEPATAEGIPETNLNVSTTSEKVLEQSLELSRLLRCNTGSKMQPENNQPSDVPSDPLSTTGGGLMANEYPTKPEIIADALTVVQNTDVRL